MDGGHVTLSINGSKNIGPSYYIITLGPVPVPTYLRGELETSLDTELGITGFSAGTGWQLDGTAEPGAGGKVIAGVGVSSIMSLEAAPGANASMQMGFPQAPVLREIEAILSGSIRLVALFYQQEWPLWEYKWRYPEDASQVMPARDPSSLLRNIRGADWRPIPRTYSSGLSLQKLNARTRDSMILTLGSGTEQILPGQEDIYPCGSRSGS